jgi:hypothetical protein
MANVMAMCFSLSNVLAVIGAVRVVPPAANYLRAGPLMRRTVSAYRLLFFLLPFLYLIGKTGGEESCNDRDVVNITAHSRSRRGGFPSEGVSLLLSCSSRDSHGIFPIQRRTGGPLT